MRKSFEEMKKRAEEVYSTPESHRIAFTNALAVYGLCPFIAYMVACHNQGLEDHVQYCKYALSKFNTDSRFLSICQQNRVVLTGNALVGNYINVFDLALKELGYFEKYNITSLEQDVNGIANFINTFDVA